MANSASGRRHPANDKAGDGKLLEAPGGQIKVRGACRGGKAERIFVLNLPSLGVSLEVSGLPRLTADT